MKLAYQAEWQGKKITAHFGLLLLYIAILFAILVVMWQQEHLQQLHAARIGQRIFTLTSLIATVVVVCVTPLLSVSAITMDKEKHTLTTIALSPARSVTIVLGKLVLPSMLALTVIGVSVIPLVSLKLSLGGVTSADIFRTHGLLLTFAMGMLTLGLFCSALFSTVHTATGVVYLTIVCLVGGAIMAGPLLSCLSHTDGLIRFVLLVNPLIGMSSAIDFDILRTEFIYTISPLGQRRFVYPSWDTVLTCYLFSSLMLLLGTVWRVDHLRHSFDKWGSRE